MSHKENPLLVDILKNIGEIFPIYIENQKWILSQCLMPDILLDTDNKVEDKKHIKGKVPDVYFKADSLQQRASYREFLMSIGVKPELDFRRHGYVYGSKSRIQVSNVNKEKFQLDGYINHCKRAHNDIKNIFKTGTHEVENLITCDFIDKIHLPGYNEIFWKLLVKYFEAIFNCKYFTPSAAQKDHVITPFIKYYLENNNCIEVKNSPKNSPRFSSSKLYAPFFAKEFDKFPFPTADIPEFVPAGILARLGFRVSLTFKDAFKLLKNPLYQTSRKFLGKIYKTILTTYESSSLEHKGKVVNFFKKNPLMTTSGELRKISTIYWYDYQSDTPFSDLFFDPCGLSFNEAQMLSSIFGIAAFSKNEELSNLDYSQLTDSDKENEIKENLISKTVDFLHVATLYTASQKGLSYKDEDEIYKIANQYLEKLGQLKLVCCDDLNFAFEAKFNRSDSVSEDENSDEDLDKVIIKHNQIFFTKNTFDENSPELFKSIAAMIFEEELLKDKFPFYMIRVAGIRQHELKLKKKFQNRVKELQKFFSNKKSSLLQSPQGSQSGLDQPSQSLNLSFDESQNILTPPTSPGKLFHGLDLPISPILQSSSHAECKQVVDGNKKYHSEDTDNVSKKLSPLEHLPTSKNKPSSSKASGIGASGRGSPFKLFDSKSQSDRAKTGREGERCFYELLLNQARKKFSDALVKEDNNGFTVKNETEQTILEVEWLNKITEQGQRRDIRVTYEGKQQGNRI